MLLKLESINVFIQASHIIRNVSLEVAKGEVVCLVGRNGAGKSTILRTIMGFLKPQSGGVEFMKQDISGFATHKIAKMGIGYAPEDEGIFPNLTVQENIEIGSWVKETSRSPEEKIKFAYEVFPKLIEYKSRRGGQISGGERKMLSIARALTLEPTMLLLDEPFEGLSPAITISVKERISEISSGGVSMLIAESNMNHVPEFTKKLYVIERGEIVFAGRPEEVHGKEAILKIITGYG